MADAHGDVDQVQRFADVDHIALGEVALQLVPPDAGGFAPARACLDPRSYVASQGLAAELLEAGSMGVIYPSVRRPEGVNLACFRPALVGNVRKGPAYRLTWAGTPQPRIEII